MQKNAVETELAFEDCPDAPGLGTSASLVDLQAGCALDLTFDFDDASSASAFGVFALDRAKGHIRNVALFFGGAVGDATFAAQPGDQIGFFTVSNGWCRAQFEALGPGRYMLLGGCAPEIFSGAEIILVHVAPGGLETRIEGPILLTHAYDELSTEGRHGLLP